MNIVKVKVFTILSLLMLRYHGILMTGEEKSIIFKTIEWKKKKMAILDSKRSRQH
jgi:hypothetical protein